MSWQALAFDLLLRVTCKSRLQDHALPVARRRLTKLLDRASSLIATPDSVERLPAEVGGVPCEWVVAESARSATDALVYFHGGAFISGSPRTHLDVAWRMSAACRRRILLVDYRLAPTHVFPAALDDAMAAYRALRGGRHGSARIAFAGDSAGANLALAAISRSKLEGLPLPDCCVCLSPWIDLTHSGQSVAANATRESMLPIQLLRQAARTYAGKYDLDHPGVSPLYARLDGFPPLLIYASEAELLVDDARRLAHHARAAGVSVKLCIWPAQSHAFPTVAAFVPEARIAIEEIGRFVNSERDETEPTPGDAFARIHFSHVTHIDN